MRTALEQMHEIEPHIQVGRARAGVLMLILSDSLSVVAILASGGYLSALNVEGQFKQAGDHTPAFLPGLLIAIALVLSGLAYSLWARGIRKQGGQAVFFALSLLFMVGALVGQIWMGAKLGYSSPFHAYVSLVLLLTWFSAAHLLLTALVGVLLLGRIIRGRVAQHTYIPEVVGYWWYYTIVAGLLMWLFIVVLAS